MLVESVKPVWLQNYKPGYVGFVSMWTTSYFCSTAGNVSSAAIKKYIEAQSKK